jgi:ADP-heptose:LPS heptosyltransferase
MKNPRKVLILHCGGIGDLVLASDVLVSLRRSWPESHISLLCREACADTQELWPVLPDTVYTLALNPYAIDTPSADLLSAMTELTGKLRDEALDLIICAAYSPTWLDWLLSSALRPAAAVGVFEGEPPRGLLPHLLRDLNLEPGDIRTPATREFPHEKLRYRALIEMLGVSYVESPPWVLPGPAHEAAAQFLENLGLTQDRYIACFPLGTPRVKCWPSERFVELLAFAQRQFEVDVLLIGDDSERTDLEGIAGGLPKARVFTGRPGHLDRLAGLLAHCRAWLGVDSGPMHLAQAYRKPGLAIFGGGTNAVYTPWAPGAVALVHRLPCFGCYWNCAFGHGICVDAIPTNEALQAFADVLNSPPPAPETRELALLPADLVSIIGEASEKYRESERDRRMRFHLLVELEHEREQLLEVARERDRALTSQSEALLEMKNIAEEREASLRETQAEMENIRRTAEERESGMLEMNAHLTDLRSIAVERERGMIELSEQLNAMRQIAEERERGMIELSEQLNAMRQIAELRERGLIDLDKHLQAMSRTAAERERGMIEIDSALRRQREIQARDLDRIRQLEQQLDANRREIKQLLEQKKILVNELNLPTAKALLRVLTRRQGGHN